MLVHLRAHHGPLCRQWFDEIEPAGMSGGVLRLRAHSNVHRDYLRRACLEQFNDSARTVSQRLISVGFLGPDDDLPSASADQPTATVVRPVSAGTVAAAGGRGTPVGRHGVTGAARSPQHFDEDDASADHDGTTTDGRLDGSPNGALDGAARGRAGRADAPPPPRAVFGSGTGGMGGGGSGGGGAIDTWSHSLVINPDYSFEHFVVGPGNRLAHAAALAVAANPGRAYNPYFVHGDVGLGKTHLLQAICLRIKENQPKARIYYTSCEGFMTQFMDSVKAGEMAAFRHTFRDVDVLVVDDIHFLTKRDRTQEEFFHTFNSLFQAHKQIILSSDAPPEEIPDLEDRLVSRFKWGLVTTVAAPGYETRVEILKNKARLRGMDLPDEVAFYIASRVERNIRELEGAVIKLQVLAAVEGRSITADGHGKENGIDVELARQALGDDSPRAERQVQIQSIIDTVTDYFGVKVTDLQSKRRQRSIAVPRQVCMFLARKHTRYSLEEIGGYFGGRDHTTVMHAVKTIESRCEIDEEFSRVVSSLELTLKA